MNKDAHYLLSQAVSELRRAHGLMLEGKIHPSQDGITVLADTVIGPQLRRLELVLALLEPRRK